MTSLLSNLNISSYPGLSRLHSWFLQDVLPVWAEQARDKATGHFHEGLALDGNHLSATTLRTRTAARMIYVYSEAEHLKVLPRWACGIATKAFDALTEHAICLTGGYVRSIDRVAQKIIDPIVDLYDQSCVLLAAASLYKLTGEARYYQSADNILTMLDGGFLEHAGGWSEDNIRTLPRRQNPHMHMFEALTVLAQATCEQKHWEFVNRIEMLMYGKFLRDGVLHEYFGPGWEVGQEWGSKRLDPGHMAEWSWLLFFSGRRNPKLSEQLLATALKIGTTEPDRCFLIDEVSMDGQVLSRGRRLWLQAELIKACLATENFDQADRTATALFDTYLTNAPRGTWRDRFDLDGTQVSESIPASSCYHLWTAVAPLCHAVELAQK